MLHANGILGGMILAIVFGVMAFIIGEEDIDEVIGGSFVLGFLITLLGFLAVFLINL